MKCRHCVQPYTDSPRGFWDTLHWKRRLGGRHVAAVFLLPRDRRTSRVGHIWSSLPFFSPRGISAGQAYTLTWGHFVRLIYQTAALVNPQPTTALLVFECFSSSLFYHVGNEEIKIFSIVTQYRKWSETLVMVIKAVVYTISRWIHSNRKQLEKFISFQSKHVTLHVM